MFTCIVTKTHVFNHNQLVRSVFDMFIG